MLSKTNKHFISCICYVLVSLFTVRQLRLFPAENLHIVLRVCLVLPNLIYSCLFDHFHNYNFLAKYLCTSSAVMLLYKFCVVQCR